MKSWKLIFSALFCAGLALPIFLAACAKSQSSPAPPVTRAKPDKKRVLGYFSRVEGTSYLIAPIHTKNEGGLLSKIESGGYGYDRAVHNYVFFNLEDESTKQLLPTNDSLIFTTAPSPKKETVQWFFYDVVKLDTNGDQELTYKDRKTLAVSDSGGAGYTELISDVEMILGYELKDAKTLQVIYVKGSKKYHSRIDLPNRHVAVTNELPALGTDVE